MKYLKKFEFQDQKYVEGDYVYVTKLIQSPLRTKIKGKDFCPYCQIVMSNAKNYDRTWDYMVFLIQDNKLANDYVFEKDILRTLTIEELEELEARKEALKYNL